MIKTPLNYFIVLLATMIISLAILSGCTAKNEKGEFAHVVLFWLNNPENDKDRTAFENSLKKFIDQSEYVRSVHFGPPANTPRDVVDNSYTYCMIVTFDSKEDQDLYQQEGVHKQFVNESKHLWKEVKVFDSIDQW